MRPAAFLRYVPRAWALCLLYRVRLKRNAAAVLRGAEPEVRPRGSKRPRVSDISRAVYFAARSIPGTHCLPQALAARDLLRWNGVPARLCLGVATSGGFHAHAWVTVDGDVVHGATDEAFTPLK